MAGSMEGPRAGAMEDPRAGAMAGTKVGGAEGLMEDPRVVEMEVAALAVSQEGVATAVVCCRPKV